jgi:hyperosmotically inducible periplasmic protein
MFKETIINSVCSIVLLAAGASVSLAENRKPGGSSGRSEGIRADNTEVNERDRQDGEVTADQASMSGAAADLTARIRSEIVDEKSLSNYAHNVKIITTDDNKVVLKGPVRSQEEKSKVEAIAKRSAGNFTIDNQLEVTAPDILR